MSPKGSSNYYETNAAEYAAMKHEAPWREQLEKFAALLQPESTILDLGCGPGRDSRLLADKGFNVVSIDSSPAMASEANERHGITVRVERIEDFSDLNAYDAVWASASIHHVERSGIPAVIKSVANSLKTGGTFHSSYKMHEGDTVDSLGRYYAAISEKGLRSMFDGSGLVINEIDQFSGMGADGNPSSFLCVMARKSAC